MKYSITLFFFLLATFSSNVSVTRNSNAKDNQQVSREQRNQQGNGFAPKPKHDDGYHKKKPK